MMLALLDLLTLSRPETSPVPALPIARDSRCRRSNSTPASARPRAWPHCRRLAT